MWKLEEAWRPPYDANTTLPVYVEAVQYDRSRLGSTAEHLLRTVRCPAFIVGPNALLRDREAAPVKRILCPTSSLEIADSIFCFAGHFAGQMRGIWNSLMWLIPLKRMCGLDNAAKNGLLNCASEASK